MGKIDSFFNEKMKELQNEVEKEKQSIEKYRKEAKQYLKELRNYYIYEIEVIPFLKKRIQPVWFSYFKNFFEGIVRNPENVKLEDDFILRQLKTVRAFFKKPFWPEFREKFSVYMIYMPIMLLLNYIVFSTAHMPLRTTINNSFLASIEAVKHLTKYSFFSYPAIKLIIPLILLDIYFSVKILRERYTATVFFFLVSLMALYLKENNMPEPIGAMLATFKTLEMKEKFAILEFIMFSYLIMAAKIKSDCIYIEKVYSFIYEWAAKLKEED